MQNENGGPRGALWYAYTVRYLLRQADAIVVAAGGLCTCSLEASARIPVPRRGDTLGTKV